MGFHATGLDPHLLKVFLPTYRPRMAETPLFANPNQGEPVQHAQRTLVVLQSHPLQSESTLTSFSYYSLSAEQVSPSRLVLCSISSCPVLRSMSPPPLGGGGKRKKTRWEKRWCIRTFWATLAIQCQWSRLHDVFLGFVSDDPYKKKSWCACRPHTRATFATPPLVGYGHAHCYFMAVLYLLIKMNWDCWECFGRFFA